MLGQPGQRFIGQGLKELGVVTLVKVTLTVNPLLVWTVHAAPSVSENPDQSNHQI